VAIFKLNGYMLDIILVDFILAGLSWF
jgi:hypothetical protein